MQRQIAVSERLCFVRIERRLVAVARCSYTAAVAARTSLQAPYRRTVRVMRLTRASAPLCARFSPFAIQFDFDWNIVEFVPHGAGTCPTKRRR